MRRSLFAGALMAGSVLTPVGPLQAQSPFPDPDIGDPRAGAASDAAGGVDFVLRPEADDPDGDADDAMWISQLQDEAVAYAGDGVPEPVEGRPVPGARPGELPIGNRQTGRPPAAPTVAPASQAAYVSTAVPANAAELQTRRVPLPDPYEGTGLDPFSPIGFNLGGFIIRPSIEVGVAATDNVRQEPDGEGAVGLLLAPQVNVLSETDRRAIELNARLAAILYGDSEIDERDADVRMRARYDLTARTSVKAEAGYRYNLDRYTDPDTPDGATERPPVQYFDLSLGGTQQFGRSAIGLTATAEREQHSDVELAGGGTASLDALDNTEYGVRLRATYGIDGTLSPYIEVGGGWREYDIASGRSGVFSELRGGIGLDFGAKLSGDVALGLRHETPDDDALDDVLTPVVAASVLWSPRRSTDLRLDVLTDVQSTGLPDATASVLYSGRLTASQRLNARFGLEAGLGLDVEDYAGIERTDVTYSAFMGGEWSFNRVASLAGRYAFEHESSDASGADYNENTVSVRLRLQR